SPWGVISPDGSTSATLGSELSYRAAAVISRTDASAADPSTATCWTESGPLSSAFAGTTLIDFKPAVASGPFSGPAAQLEGGQPTAIERLRTIANGRKIADKPSGRLTC